MTVGAHRVHIAEPTRNALTARHLEAQLVLSVATNAAEQPHLFSQRRIVQRARRTEHVRPVRQTHRRRCARLCVGTGAPAHVVCKHFVTNKRITDEPPRAEIRIRNVRRRPRSVRSHSDWSTVANNRGHWHRQAARQQAGRRHQRVR